MGYSIGLTVTSDGSKETNFVAFLRILSSLTLIELRSILPIVILESLPLSTFYLYLLAIRLFISSIYIYDTEIHSTCITQLESTKNLSHNNYRLDWVLPIVSEKLFNDSMVNLWKFSEKIGFAAAPFLTVLIDKRNGAPRNRDATVQFFLQHNLYDDKRKIFLNPWSNYPYVTSSVCATSIGHYRLPSQFGCWNNQDTKLNCNKIDCRYHPRGRQDIGACNFQKDVIWKIGNLRNFQHFWGSNYVEIIKKNLLKDNKIRIIDLLTVFYRNDQKIDDETYQKFTLEFNFNDTEMREFFTTLESYQTISKGTELTNSLSLASKAEDNNFEKYEKRLYFQSPKINAELPTEEVLKKLQEFTFDNGRLPQINEPSMQNVIQLAKKQFGTLENALFVAGLIVEPSKALNVRPTRVTQKKPTFKKILENVIIQLIDNNPLSFRDINNKVKQISGFSNVQKETIRNVIGSSEHIESIGPRRKMLYFLKGQENLALKKIEVNYESLDVQDITDKQSNNILAQKNVIQTVDTLANIIVQLLQSNPMTTDELLVGVKNMPRFKDVGSGVVTAAILFSNQIRTTGSWPLQVYFLPGQEEIAERLLKGKVPSFDNQTTVSERIESMVDHEKSEIERRSEQYIENLTPRSKKLMQEPETLQEAIIGLLDQDPMTFNQLRIKVKKMHAFRNVSNGLINEVLFVSRKIDWTGPHRQCVYFLKGQETLASEKLWLNSAPLTDANQSVAEIRDADLIENKSCELEKGMDVIHKEVSDVEKNSNEVSNNISQNDNLQSQTLDDVIARLLKDNPMTFGQVQSEVRAIAAFKNVRNSAIRNMLFISKNIKWTGDRKHIVYCLKGQEQLALEKIGKKIKIDGYRISSQISAQRNKTEKDKEQRSSDIMNTTGSERKSDDVAWQFNELHTAVTSLLEHNSMSLKQIRDELGGFKGYSRIPYSWLITLIQRSKNIKRACIDGCDRYFLEGQEPLEIDKVSTDLLTEEKTEQNLKDKSFLSDANLGMMPSKNAIVPVAAFPLALYVKTQVLKLLDFQNSNYGFSIFQQTTDNDKLETDCYCYCLEKTILATFETIKDQKSNLRKVIGCNEKTCNNFEGKGCLIGKLRYFNLNDRFKSNLTKSLHNQKNTDISVLEKKDDSKDNIDNCESNQAIAMQASDINVTIEEGEIGKFSNQTESKNQTAYQNMIKNNETTIPNQSNSNNLSSENDSKALEKVSKENGPIENNETILSATLIEKKLSRLARIRTRLFG